MVPEEPKPKNILCSLFGIKDEPKKNICSRCSRTRHTVQQCHATKDANGVELPPNPLYIPQQKSNKPQKRQLPLTDEERVQKRQARAEQRLKENRKTMDCNLWIQGKCVLGDNCNFKHEPGKGFDPRSKQLCQYFRSGSCVKGENCIYSHTKSDFPCAFHLKGKCRVGDQCEFSHLPMTKEQELIYNYEQEKFKNSKNNVSGN